MGNFKELPENFSNYSGDKLRYDLLCAGYPGIVLERFGGDGSVGMPYEKLQGLSNRNVVYSSSQAAAVAHEILSSIGTHNRNFWFKANNVVFFVSLDDGLEPKVLTCENHPYESSVQLHAFIDNVILLLRKVISQYKRQLNA